MEFQDFYFKPRDIYSLELIRHGYFFPYFVGTEKTIRRGERFKDKPFGIEIFQENEDVVIRVFYSENAKENEIKELARKWAEAIGVFESFEKMREEFSDQKVSKVLEVVKGYHLPSSINPFEILISAVISQNIKAEKFRALFLKMVETLGDEFGNFFIHPPFEKIAQSENVLRKMGFGYRSKYVVQVSTWIVQNAHKVSFEKSTNELLKELVKIKGIGIYTATSFLLFGLRRYDAPLYDRLICRICSEFLGKQAKSFSEFDKITQEMWGKWRGAVIAHICVYYRIKNKLGRLV